MCDKTACAAVAMLAAALPIVRVLGPGRGCAIMLGSAWTRGRLIFAEDAAEDATARETVARWLPAEPSRHPDTSTGGTRARRDVDVHEDVSKLDLGAFVSAPDSGDSRPATPAQIRALVAAGDSGATKRTRAQAQAILRAAHARRGLDGRPEIVGFHELARIWPASADARAKTLALYLRACELGPLLRGLWERDRLVPGPKRDAAVVAWLFDVETRRRIWTEHERGARRPSRPRRHRRVPAGPTAAPGVAGRTYSLRPVDRVNTASAFASTRGDAEPRRPRHDGGQLSPDRHQLPEATARGPEPALPGVRAARAPGAHAAGDGPDARRSHAPRVHTDADLLGPYDRALAVIRRALTGR